MGREGKQVSDNPGTLLISYQCDALVTDNFRKWCSKDTFLNLEYPQSIPSLLNGRVSMIRGDYTPPLSAGRFSILKDYPRSAQDW